MAISEFLNVCLIVRKTATVGIPVDSHPLRQFDDRAIHCQFWRRIWFLRSRIKRLHPFIGPPFLSYSELSAPTATKSSSRAA